MRQAYKKLGQNEPVDQTDFAKYLVNTYDYIDSSKVAIWGWVSATSDAVHAWAQFCCKMLGDSFV